MNTNCIKNQIVHGESCVETTIPDGALGIESFVARHSLLPSGHRVLLSPRRVDLGKLCFTFPGSQGYCCLQASPSNRIPGRPPFGWAHPPEPFRAWGIQYWAGPGWSGAACQAGRLSRNVERKKSEKSLKNKVRLPAWAWRQLPVAGPPFPNVFF